tara:strand:- start:1369 stop:1698 length:330 start_codon:yes stop_codon:yes gene_type:complete
MWLPGPSGDANDCGTIRYVAWRCGSIRYVAWRCGSIRYVAWRWGEPVRTCDCDEAGRRWRTRCDGLGRHAPPLDPWVGRRLVSEHLQLFRWLLLVRTGGGDERLEKNSD